APAIRSRPPAPAAGAPTSAVPPESRSPRVGKASTEQATAATSTTVVRVEPAAPSTSPCEALRSAAVQAGTPPAADGAGEAAGDGASVATGGEIVAAAVGAAGVAVAAGLQPAATSTASRAAPSASRWWEAAYLGRSGPRRSSIAGASIAT